PPTITSLSTNSGTDGSPVTITGTNFTGVTAVAFNTTAATFNFVDDSHITTSVPAGATTGPVKVTTPGGFATSSTFTVQPSLPSFSPSHGVVGATVVVTGSGFTGATSVSFNGTSQTVLT